MVTETAPDTGIILISKNTYEIMDTDYRGIFGSEKSLINRNLEKVNKFALEKNMIAIPIESRIHRVGISADWAWFYYKFKLVTPSSPEANIKFTDITTERDARLSAEFYKQRNRTPTTKATSIKHTSKYEELLRLNELKEKGILTEAEFIQEKEKLLNN